MDANFTNSLPEAPNDENAKRMARINKVASALGEHFDCVVVLAHVVENGNSVCRFAKICGDPLAAQQAAVLFLQDNMQMFARKG